MKKVISLTLVITVLTSILYMPRTFAENIITDHLIRAEKVSKPIGDMKCNVSLASVEVAGDANTAFGSGTAIFDDVGMVGDGSITDGVYIPSQVVKEYLDEKGVGAASNAWRWMAKNGAVLPMFTITLNSAITLNKVRFTEARKLISGYKITCYNGAEKVLENAGSFSDFSSDNNLYLREIILSKTVTVDKVVFEVTSRSNIANNGISIAEMEFWKSNGIAVSCDTEKADGAADIEAIMDSVGMVSAVSGETAQDLSARWAVAAGATPAITMTFAEDVTFDRIYFTEVNKQISGYTITCFREGIQVFSKSGTLSDSASDNLAHSRTINIGEEVLTDKVVFSVTSTVGTEVISIQEIELFSGIYAPRITDGAGEVSSIDTTAVFDGNEETKIAITPDSNGKAVLYFNLQEVFVVDKLKIISDDIANAIIYGTLDKENYFEIGHTSAGDSYHFDNYELLMGIKAELTVLSGSASIGISEVELTSAPADANFDALYSLYKKESTELITSEPLSAITQNINNPLPTVFGSYTIEWISENSNIVNVETGIVTKTYMQQNTTITAKFMRNGTCYKENVYSLTICDDGSVSASNIYTYSDNYANLSGNIISSSVKDANDSDPTNKSVFGDVSKLYNESGKTCDFSIENADSWGLETYTNTTSKYQLPYTMQFDLSTTVAVNGLDIFEYRDRVNEVSVQYSLDGVEWENAVENVNISQGDTTADDEKIFVKKIRFPLVHAQHLRVVIHELKATSRFVAAKICEIVLLNEQNLPTLNGIPITALTDDNPSTYAEIEETGSIMIDMGKISGFDTLKWLNAGACVENYSVSVGNAPKAMEEIKSGSIADSDTNRTEISLGTYCLARFIKLDITSVYTDESAKLSELYITEESGTDRYLLEKKFARLVSKEKTDILVDEELTCLMATELDAIPDTISFYHLTWDFSKATMINPETKAVTHTDKDLSGQIRVEVTDSMLGIMVYSGMFDIISKATIAESDYYSVAKKNSLISENYDFARPEGFLFNQGEMKLEFMVNTANTGAVTIIGDAELIKVDVSSDRITINHNGNNFVINASGAVRIRVMMEKNDFDLYADVDGNGYKGFVGQGAYSASNSNGIKAINTTTAIEQIELAMKRNDIPAFLDQLSLSNISNETMYTVTSQLTYLNEIIGLPIIWSSSHNDVIDAQSGKVNTEADPTFVRLTAAVHVTDVVNWSKNLYAAVNMINIISEASVGTNTTAYQSNALSNAYDAEIDTSFKTNYKKGYNIKITFPSNTLISQVVMLEDTSEGRIQDYNIYLDDKLVYEGGALNGFANCFIDAVYGKEIKIDVLSTTDITGLKEISIFSELTKGQKANADLEDIAIAASYTNGTYTLPKTGVYGSAISYTANKNVVSFADGTDGITMTFNNNATDIAVMITAKSVIDGVERTKSFSTVSKGEKTVGYQPPSGGTSGSSGNGGGGNRGNYVPTGTSALTEPISGSGDVLTGHWAENEIRSLVDNRIVKGDGNSLNLDSTVTRAEFLAMLIRVFDLELSRNECVFEDVNADSWYAATIQTAYEHEWVEGYNRKVLPDAPITREEMAKIICTAVDITSANDDTELIFTDEESQSEWAKDYIKSLSSYNIIKGYEDGSFKPKNNLRRDEAMVVIYRIINMEVE